VLDGLKGWLPVVLVKWFGKDYGLDDATMAAVAFAAFLGHLFPVFFGFKGGKGVATAAGALLGIEWLLGLATLVTWLVVAYFTRYSSLAAMASAAFAPLYYLLGDRGPWYAERGVLLAIFMISLLLMIRHKDNINKLMSGKESKLSFAKSPNK
jgi:acyl phosphate:glycerol-3-phosphate acyltransferase